MSVKEIKALTRRAFEELNKGNAAAMALFDELAVPDYVFHGGSGKDDHSLRDYKKRLNAVYNAFPDLHFTLDDMIVEGDKVANRWTLTATHKGEFEGIPATNKKVKIWAISIDRLAGGKFVESWERFDTLSLMQQLGVVPTSGKGK
jgi:predicted ester cyclase